MNTLRNAIKKVAVIGSGAVLATTTIASALAATTATGSMDLSMYPQPFVQNGQFNGLIVVGEKAASQDIIGAIDIASSIQAASASPAGNSGSGSTTVLTGDVKQIESAGDVLEIGEQLGSVTETLTDSDLKMLQGGSVTTQRGTTDFTQTIDLNVGTAGSNLVKLDRDNDEKTGVFLFFQGNSPIFNYELEFTSGMESDIDTGHATDLEDENIYMLGQTYSISNAVVTGTSGLSLDLLSGDVTDTLAQGETKTYTVNGKQYEVSVLAIGTSSGDSTVKFLVNGEATDSLVVGDTDTLSDGVEIGVRDVIETTAYREKDQGSIVEFYLGANKITIDDANVNSSATGAHASVEINNENQNHVTADLGAAITSTTVRLNNINYQVEADAKRKTDIYLHEGEGLRDQLQRPEALLNDNWDITYQGLSKPKMNPIEINAEGDDQYNLVFTNLRGNTYDVPYAYAGDATDNNGNWGDDQDAFVFSEAGKNATGSFVASTFNVGLDDYFLLTDSATNSTADNGDNSYVLQFSDVNTDDSTISLTDVSTGEEIVAQYTPTGTVTTTVTSPVNGTIHIGGKDFTFWMYDSGSSAYRLAVDQNKNGALDSGSIVDIVAKGGAVVQPSNASAYTGAWKLNVLTDSDDVDSSATQAFNVTFTETNDQLDLSIPTSSGAGADVTGTYYYSTVRNEDRSEAVTGYGAMLHKTDNTDSADELTIDYPEEQVQALVYVTGGDVQSSTTSTGGSVRINPVGVGSAVLDSDVTLDQANMIVVGGPCVNTIAAQLMDNPADCAAGFTQGHATLKLFDTGKNTALLVAGYSAQDTVGASRVLAEYGDYKLSGSEMDVTVASLKDIQVSKKQ